jgi:signal peptidase II
MLPHWPVFNVADICINVAAGLILLQAFRGVRSTAPRDRAADGRDDGADAAADRRSLSVPDGLAGERVDAAMARHVRLSRTRRPT